MTKPLTSGQCNKLAQVAITCNTIRTSSSLQSGHRLEQELFDTTIVSGSRGFDVFLMWERAPKRRASGATEVFKRENLGQPSCKEFNYGGIDVAGQPLRNLFVDNSHFCDRSHLFLVLRFMIFFLTCFLPVLASGRRRQMPGQLAPVVTRRWGSQFLLHNHSRSVGLAVTMPQGDADTVHAAHPTNS